MIEAPRMSRNIADEGLSYSAYNVALVHFLRWEPQNWCASPGVGYCGFRLAATLRTVSAIYFFVRLWGQRVALDGVIPRPGSAE